MGQTSEAFSYENIYDENTWINARTGEIRQFDNAHKQRSNGKLFIKVFRKEYEPITEQIKGQEHAVLDYFINHYNTSTNIVKATIRVISKKTGISESTVARAIKTLRNLNFIRYKKDGEWIVNPYVSVYGDEYDQRRIYAIFIECKK